MEQRWSSPPAGRTRELGYCNLSPSREFDKITSQAPVATTFILVTGVSFAYENELWVSCNSRVRPQESLPVGTYLGLEVPSLIEIWAHRLNLLGTHSSSPHIFVKGLLHSWHSVLGANAL